MAKLFIPFLFVALLPVFTDGQVRRGTAIFFLVSAKGDYVVIAADSRQTSNGIVDNDQECKIISLGGKTIFFAIGNVDVNAMTEQKVPIGHFIANNTARTIIHASPDSDIPSLADAWAETPVTLFRKFPSEDLLRMKHDANDLVTGCFLRYDKAVLSLRCDAVIFDPKTAAIEVTHQGSSDPGAIGYFGPGTALVREFIDGKTKRAAEARRSCCPDQSATNSLNDSKLVEGVIKFIMTYSTGEEKTFVGGPVDVVLMRDTGGIEWIARKKNCRDNQN